MVLLLDWISWFGVACLIFFGIVGYNGIQRWRKRNLYHPTLDAIQGGDEAKLKAAPPPASLYDFWMDTITQEYILKRYTKLAETWFGHRAGFDTRNAAHDVDILGYLKQRSEINADIKEQKLRGAEASIKKRNLSRPPEVAKVEEKPRDKTPGEKRAEELDRWQKEKAWFDKHGYPEGSEERERAQNIHEDLINKINAEMSRNM